ncbi:MAG: short-chain dehydrogenase [Marmoricola sp.]|nr:short-chain dehydrogenase [Marmoricola sp.]
MSDVQRMLEGRVVIVTGGGRGIGRSHCLELAAHGATVVVNDLGVGLAGDSSGDDPAAEVVAAIRDGGGTASANGSSVSDWSGVASLMAETVATYGKIDAIVNNAGILRDATITSMTEDAFDAVINVHLKGTFTMTKHACDYWRSEQKAGRPVVGRIVNTTSGTGLAGNVGQVAYGAAKAAIANMTQTTAMEAGRYGVTANCISPVAATRMTAAVGMAAVEPDAGWNPLDPANSSPVVAWLCSEQSGWLTGRVLRIDGSAVMPVDSWSVRGGYRSRSGEMLEAGEIDQGLRKAFGLAPLGLAGLQPQTGHLR